MSHSTVYRICLLIVVILTIIGGIFYYVNYMESQTRVTEGTLVREEVQDRQQGDISACWNIGQQENMSASRDAGQEAVA